ncbi:MAG: MBOAT family protein [Erythrobacter sp.]|nr:MBOAT family protein [Erythrobacter sp.]NCQ63300.1 MBOAT family protein [Alphaproteobacteria bacterium]
MDPAPGRGTADFPARAPLIEAGPRRMIFHSLDYLLFLPIVAALFFLVPHRWRWVLLLAASNLFYGSWRVEFLALLLFTTFVDFFVAQRLMEVRGKKLRRLLFGASMLCNLGPLIFFKYSALLAGTTFYDVRVGNFTLADVILPLGISFYTFQTLGYTIDVYRGKREAETHLGIFAVYVMYFPQLLAGPIERPYKLLPQLREEQVFDLRRAAMGGALILVGYFKKLVIADRLGLLVPPILAAPEAHTSLTVTLATLGALYRYYADLSGYADIAIGSSLIMGIALTQNFRRPYAAVSIAEFWQRWHITVTRWFTDYVYIPIARHTKVWSRFVATVVTTLLISLWHGASTSWLVAGGIAGLLMIGEGWVRRQRGMLAGSSRALARAGVGERGSRLIGRNMNRAVLWFFLLFLGSIVNAPGWDQTYAIWGKIAHLPGEALTLSAGLGALQVSKLFLFAIVALEFYQWLDARRPVFDRLESAGAVVAWPFWWGLAATILMFGVFTGTGFLYFDF